MNYIDKTVDYLLSFFFTSEKVLVTDVKKDVVDATKLVPHTNYGSEIVYETRYELRTHTTGGWKNPSTYTTLVPVMTSRLVNKDSTSYSTKYYKNNVTTLVTEIQSYALSDVEKLYEDLKEILPRKTPLEVILNKFFKSITSVEVDGKKYFCRKTCDDLFFTGYSFSCMFIVTAYIFREIYDEYRKLKY